MRLLLVKWRQILCSPCFFLSAVVTAVLCFTTELETDTGESTVFEILLSFLMQKDAGLQEVGETETHIVMKYELKEPYEFELVDYSVVY